MDDVLDFLEFICSILCHALEAMFLCKPIMIIDWTVKSWSNTSSLIWWKDYHLRSFHSILIELQKCLIYCCNTNKFLSSHCINKKVVPEHWWLYLSSSFNEEGQKCLSEKVLLMESCVWKSYSLNDEFWCAILVKFDELFSWHCPCFFLNF